MKKVVLFLALCAGVVSLQAQTDNTKANNNYREVTVDEGVFVKVENPAEFPGGEEALLEYIVNNIQYPAKIVVSSFCTPII